ncbi:MAG TPA: M55 family metallopeptidase [Gemmatimonadales bacterium]|nr:M55 family metallopeptidase [Gemmatimonadales bacterium]
MMRRVGFLACLCLLLVRSSLDAQSAAPPGWTWNAVSPARGPLRILVIYDMEGLSGLNDLEMTECGYPDSYAAGQARLAADVNAVIEGLFQARVSSVDVADRHGSGCEDTPDLPSAFLHPKAREVSEHGAPFLERIGRGDWDAVVLVGGHASPGRGGFLEHVGGFGFERIINGVSVSESEQTGLVFGGSGVPIIFASGDDRYGAQLRERMPWVGFVEVKRATSRTSVELRIPDAVRAELIARARDAIANRDRAMTLALVPPLTGAYRPVWPQTLEPLAGIPGVDVSKGQIEVSGGNLAELNAAINKVQFGVASVTTSGTMWDAITQERQLDRSRDSVFMARWKEGPPKR